MKLRVWQAAHLPASVGQHEETEGYGCPRHGVCGWHAVLGVVEDLHLHHRRGRRPGPADHVLGGLSHEQVPGPDDDESPAHQGVDVPEEEGEEDDEEHLVAQLGPKREQVEEKLVVDQELLAHVSGQGVFPERFRPGGVRIDISWCTIGRITLHPVNLRCGRIPGCSIPNSHVRALLPVLDPLPQPGKVRLRLSAVRLGRFNRKCPFNAA